MSEFVNSVAIVGQDAFIDSIIDRSITELIDDALTKVGNRVFDSCTALTTVNLPNVKTIGEYCFNNCSALTTVDMPLLTSIPGRGFQICGIIKARFASLTSIQTYGLTGNNNMKALILSNETQVCSVVGAHCIPTGITSGTGYIYVPSALLESYKAATNWSTYADQFRALEDYTVDGTTTGELALYSVTYSLSRVTSTDATTSIAGLRSYTTTLSSENENAIEEVSITMGGVDITADVYNAKTGEVYIPLVTGDLVITAMAESSGTLIVSLTPYNGSEEGELPFYKMDVTAGQIITLTYYLTKQQGYIYDGRNCGLQYYGSVAGSAYPMDSSELNTETVKTIEIPSDGVISFSGNRNDTVANGELAPSTNDRLYGKYLIIEVEG